MKHSILAALTAVLARPAVRTAFGTVSQRPSFRRISRGVWLLAHPSLCLALVRIFASAKMRPLLRIFRAEPRLMFKFLGDYLATDLSLRERAAMLIHHYEFLETHVDPEFLARIADRRLDLWQLPVGEHIYRICMFVSRIPHGEGDLTLIFDADGVDIYTLSFTIGPGSIAGLDARHAMYIARVQGKGKGLDRIREATKHCHDVSPAMLLLAAAEGVARALELGHMVGIGASAHVSANNIEAETLVKAYDEFWRAVGGERLDRAMFHLRVPMLGKSILSVRRDHRSRTNRKRRFKNLVKEQVDRAFRDAALRDARGETLGAARIPG
jgi:uncharacterized protein